MKGYDFLPHTADAKYRAYGKTLEDAFANAALAMTSVMVDPVSVKPMIKKDIVLEAEDKESLLYEWLESLLVFLDSEDFVLSDVESIRISDSGKGFSLEAVVFGDAMSDIYDLFGFVKAVTYNDMSIENKDGHWQVTVVVDR